MRYLRIVAAVAMFAYAVASFEPGARVWAVGSIAIFGVVVALQFTPLVLTRAYGLWVAFFLMAQAVLTPWLRSDFTTLPPLMRSTVSVLTDEIPGVPAGLRHVTTDERGFRVNPPVNYASKRGVRIFTIGGSTTENILLDDRATWSHLLQEKLASHFGDAEVVNTGLSGLRARHHLATLEVVSQFNPDLVIFLLGANDWNHQIRDRFSARSWKPVSLRFSAFGTIVDAAILAPLRRRVSGHGWADTDREVLGLSEFTHSSNRSLDRAIVHSFHPDGVSIEYATILNRISQFCKDRGLRCMFMTQPHAYREETPDELLSRFWMTPPDAPYTVDLQSMQHIAKMYNDFLARFAATEGLALCDLARHVEPLPELFFDDLHFTDEGARRVAEIALICTHRALSDIRPATQAGIRLESP